MLNKVSTCSLKCTLLLFYLHEELAKLVSYCFRLINFAYLMFFEFQCFEFQFVTALLQTSQSFTIINIFFIFVLNTYVCQHYVDASMQSCDVLH